LPGAPIFLGRNFLCDLCYFVNLRIVHGYPHAYYRRKNQSRLRSAYYAAEFAIGKQALYALPIIIFVKLV
jgi:hypothetical protein